MDALYNGLPPYERGSETSRAAAESIRARSPAMREVVFRFILERGPHGATDDEIEAATGYRHQTASARRRELFLLGRIVDTGGTRKTRSGRSATVWRAAKIKTEIQHQLL